MNYNFLLEGKAFALGKTTEANGLALTSFFLYVLRGIGFTPLGALGAAYLIGQALFFFAAMRLFDFFLPEASWRRRLLFVLVLAIVPLLSTDTAYKDIAVLLGAALLLAALACAFSAAASDLPRPGLLLMAAAFAVLGSACRLEVVAGVVLAAVLLFAFGSSSARPIKGVVRPRGAAVALLAGSTLGILLAFGLAFLLRGEAALSTAAYRFYTFYDGLPYLMRPEELLRPGEYGRYLASMSYFGGFDQHNGSLVAALLSHPGWALLRFVLKIPDLVGGLAWLGAITPIGIIFALIGLRGSRSLNSPRTRSILLLAFLGPLTILFVPPANDRYYLSVVFPVLLLIARGLDVSLANFSDRAVRRVTFVSLMVATMLILTLGRIEVSNSRTVNQAAAYLEAKCQSGCLVNYLPQLLSSQAWVDLEAGAPFPPKIKRSEAFVLGQYPAGYAESCRFDARVRHARERGYNGPVLYVDVQVTSAQVFSDSFDPEHKFDARPDLSGATLLAKFEADGDLIAVYRISG
jgi:MFS family permease